MRGLAKEGSSQRRKYIEELIKNLGGRLEVYYYAFGEIDSLLIADLPDATTAAAISMAVNESGAVQLKTTVLMTPEEMDQALKTSVGYRPPGT